MASLRSIEKLKTRKLFDSIGIAQNENKQKLKILEFGIARRQKLRDRDDV